jgi:hypothetical protein
LFWCSEFNDYIDISILFGEKYEWFSFTTFKGNKNYFIKQVLVIKNLLYTATNK